MRVISRHREMGLMRNLIDRVLRRSSRRELYYLLSSPLFDRVLERERMRADRNCTVFSLVELHFEPTEPFNLHLRRLERILEGRLRSTDTSGLLAGRGIGVLLPDTSVPGAQQVIADVTDLWGQVGVRLVAKVSVYSSGKNDWETRLPESLEDRRSPSDQHRPLPQPSTVPENAEAMLFVKPLPVWKRTLDLLGASAGFVLLSPLLVFVAAIVLLTSGRPVLFRQHRAGLGGHPFGMYKFRTMCRDAEEQQAALREFSEQDGPAFKLKSDPRITRLGRFLRKSSIDELPQLWNVLRGEMTLVGPRPLPCDESDGCIAWQRRRLEVTPGLTCIWQVDGKSHVPFVEWMRMDLRYIRTRTLWHDLKLIARTAVAVVFRQASH